MPRITHVSCAWLQAPIPPEQRHTSDFGLMDSFNTALVTIETEDGLTGYGEGKVHVPAILFYPGVLDGAAGLRFMGVLDAEHNYRPKIF